MDAYDAAYSARTQRHIKDRDATWQLFTLDARLRATTTIMERVEVNAWLHLYGQGNKFKQEESKHRERDVYDHQEHNVKIVVSCLAARATDAYVKSIKNDEQCVHTTR